MFLLSVSVLLCVVGTLAKPDGPGVHHHGDHSGQGHHGVHQGHHNENHHHEETVQLGGHHAVHGTPQSNQQGQTVAEIVSSHPKFTTLLSALKAANLVSALGEGQGPVTVFAPTNAAFDKVPVDALNGLLAKPEELKKVLLRHVVPGSIIQGKNIPPGITSLTTANGEQISASRDKFIQVKSNSASAFVVLFDVIGTNGVIHAIDTVI
jgi:transforming growth factor-beta-induced protein